MTFLSMIFHQIRRRRWRTLLTIAGMSVAICAVVALRGIADGFERGFCEVFEGRGVDLIVVEGGLTEQLTSSLDESLTTRLKTLDGVKDVACMLLEVLAFEKEGLMGVIVQGWPGDALMYRDLKMAGGRRPKPGEQQVEMLGGILARNMKKKIGDTVEIDREMFKVVGIFESFNIFENGAMVVPLPELQRVMRRPNQVTAFSLLLHDGAEKDRHAATVCKQIEALTTPTGKRMRLTALPTKDYVGNTLQIRIAHAMAWATSAIALIIGTIGILNTMMTSVLERTREIGILRAIGWKRSRIVVMILLESLILCVGGAMLGAGIARFLTFGMTQTPAVQGFIQGDIRLEIMVQGVLLAAVVGLIGGCYPAWRASRLAPTEALRHE
jgi:putative ABC transport system permease protein